MMADAAPLLVAQAISDALNNAVAGTFSLAFEAVFGDADYQSFEDLNDDNLRVDVMLNQKPTLELGSADGLLHTIKTVIGIRRRFVPEQRSGGKVPWSEVKPYINLWYEIAKYFLPSAATPNGRKLTTLPAAVSEPPFDVVQIYDVAQLRQGLYVGIMRVTYLYPEAY